MQEIPLLLSFHPRSNVRQKAIPSSSKTPNVELVVWEILIILKFLYGLEAIKKEDKRWQAKSQEIFLRKEGNRESVIEKLFPVTNFYFLVK